MASSRYYSLVNFLIFCSLLQKNILISGAEDQCLNLKFDQNKKIIVQYFFTSADTIEFATPLCEVIKKSNGLISMVYRVTGDMKEKATCTEDNVCIDNRRMACNYKQYTEMFNNCSNILPPLERNIADCVCAGDADDILIANQNSLKNFGITKTPALIIDNIEQLNIMYISDCIYNHEVDQKKRVSGSEWTGASNVVHNDTYTGLLAECLKPIMKFSS